MTSDIHELAESMSIDEMMTRSGFEETRSDSEVYEGATVWHRFEHGERYVLGVWENNMGIFVLSQENGLELTHVKKTELARALLVQGDHRRLGVLARELSVGPPKDLVEFAIRAGAGYHVEDVDGPASERYVFDPYFRDEVKRHQDYEEARAYGAELAEQKALLMDSRKMWCGIPIDEFLEQELGDTKWLIDPVLPVGGNCTIAASAKTGKTTFIVNLIRALTRNELFLGVYPTSPLTGKIGFLNFELTEKQCQDWLKDQLGNDADKVVVWNLRGKRNPLQTAVSRQLFAQELRSHSIQVLIIDPFSGAFRKGSGSSLDNDLVKEFLLQLDEMKTDAEVSEMVIAVHAGRNIARTRGASSLDDHPDSLLHLERNPETGLRTFRAIGRDVDIPESLLEYDPETRNLTLSNKTVAEGKTQSVEALVLKALEQGPLSASELHSRIGKRDNVVNTARDNLVSRGEVLQENLAGGKKLFRRKTM